MYGYGNRFRKEKERPKLGRSFVNFRSAVELTTAEFALAATTAATAAEVAARTLFTGFGFVDSQRATVQFLAVEIGDGLGGLFLRAHLDERKSAGLARELVHDEFAAADVAGLLEQVKDVAFSGIER